MFIKYNGAVYRQVSGAPYSDEGFVGERWGRAGAGMLFTTGTKILLLHRSEYVEEPGTWGISGGAIKINEHGQPKSPQAAAMEETKEELGRLPSGYMIQDEYLYQEPSGFKFHTFVAQVPAQAATSFMPRLNWENDDYGWFTQDELADLELHFGVAKLLTDRSDLVFWKEAAYASTAG